MSGLANYFEREGLATVNVSLVRLHSEKEPSPRALWVPFMLGRPFGAPDNSRIQRNVLDALFDILDTASSETLVDYEGEPPSFPGPGVWKAPFELPPLMPQEASWAELLQALVSEISVLQEHHQHAVRQKRRTLVGVSGHSTDSIVSLLSGYVEMKDPDRKRFPQPGMTVLQGMRDIMDTYFEAVLYQTGDAPVAAREWFWNETNAGLVFRRLPDYLRRSKDPRSKMLGESSMICPAALKLPRVESP